jgi:hypothetical protein
MINNTFNVSEAYIGRVVSVNINTHELEVYVPKLMPTLNYGFSETVYNVDLQSEVVKTNTLLCKPRNFKDRVPEENSLVQVFFVDGDIKKIFWYDFDPFGTNTYIEFEKTGNEKALNDFASMFDVNARSISPKDIGIILGSREKPFERIHGNISSEYVIGLDEKLKDITENLIIPVGPNDDTNTKYIISSIEDEITNDTIIKIDPDNEVDESSQIVLRAGSGVTIETLENVTLISSTVVGNVTTDLSATHNPTNVIINSSDGEDATINGANATTAGLMTTEAQTFSGNKTFDHNVLVNGDLSIATSKDLILGGIKTLASDGTSNYLKVGSKLYIQNQASNILGAINSDGNFGIGTHTPTSKLQVEGSTSGALALFKQTEAWNDSNFALKVEGYTDLNGFRINAADGVRGLYKRTSGGILGFATIDDVPITFTQSATQERMRIAPGGNVGIGTDSPQTKLHGVGTFRFDLGKTYTMQDVPDGSLFIGNASGSTSAPTFVSRSDDNVAMVFEARSLDSKTGSSDMMFNIRENNNTDYDTKTGGGFSFRRYTTDLMTLDRAGNLNALGEIRSNGSLVALAGDLPTVNDGTLNLAVSGIGLSGSTTFTANQAGNSTFTVTSNATAEPDALTLVSRDASGNIKTNTRFYYNASAYTVYNSVDKSIDFVFTD